jgi:hypothetical protein
LADHQFIGQEEDTDEKVFILSPIGKDEIWTQDKLLETVAMLNSCSNIRRVTLLFRKMRREIFGDDHISYTAFKNCCQVVIEELEDLIMEKLGDKYPKY